MLLGDAQVSLFKGLPSSICRQKSCSRCVGKSSGIYLHNFGTSYEVRNRCKKGPVKPYSVLSFAVSSALLSVDSADFLA